MTQIQKNIDAAVQVLVARAGFTPEQARELILAQRAKAYVPPTVWKNAPRLVVAR
jgi:hypothetical protein